MTAIRTANVTVTDTATLLTDIDETPSALSGGKVAFSFYNNGSVVCFLGGSDVTTATGTPLTPGAALTLELPASANVFGITTTTTDIRVLQVV
jgi:hypothetical protein